MTEHKIKTVGSYAEIWHGTAAKSAGGLKKKDLMKHKGRIISRKKHLQGKKSIKHLRALGFIAKKGTFKLFRKSMAHKKTAKKHGKRHTRRRGGAAGVPSTSASAPAPMMK
jgi:hypothetical protein